MRENTIFRFAQVAVPMLMCGLLCSSAVAQSPAEQGSHLAARTLSLRARAVSKTALTVASAEGAAGNGVTLMATIDGKAQSLPAGSVVFTAQGKQIGKAAVSNGSATLTVEALPAGLTSLIATYEGDSNFLPSQSAAVRFYNDEN